MACFLISPAALPSHLPKPLRACAQAPAGPPPPQSPQLRDSPPSSPALTAKPVDSPKPKPSTADSTDWIASALTRRFGLGAGLAWVGFLAAGVVSEQIKTRLEASRQDSDTKGVDKEVEVALPNGIRYYDLVVGGGAAPRSGDLVVIDLKGRVMDSGEVFVDTFGEGKRPMALVMGSRPYAKGMCRGVENVIRSMRAGGRRRIVMPPELGFGDNGADFGGDVSIQPGASLEFVVQVDKVSIPPS
ncbi:hypothetical protein KSP39_PZI010146 [Platanthera zijinensis]|uniref:peptidylprolyl isomerase n=1 Tax=Platanthera zijinensis TaxID=2320716 RepID=A0AAP0BK34_9ASPA